MSKNGLIPLDTRDQRTLDAAEADIRRGGQLIWGALKTIHERKLYRGEFETFEDYCRERWNMSDRHARRLLDHGKVLANLGFDDGDSESLRDETPQKPLENETKTKNGRARPVPSQRATAEIVDLPPNQQREVFEAATEEGKPATAKNLREAKDRVKAVRADAPMPPRQTDEDGNDVPANLVAVFESRAEFRKLSRKLRDIGGALAELKKTTAGRHLREAPDLAEELAQYVDNAMPARVVGRGWEPANA